MARSTEYADHPELLALSRLCVVTIHVWGAENTAIISANPDAREPLPIVHLAHRNAGNFRDHYWAVQLPSNKTRASLCLIGCRAAHTTTTIPTSSAALLHF